jgi:hypothetical protein
MKLDAILDRAFDWKNRMAQVASGGFTTRGDSTISSLIKEVEKQDKKVMPNLLFIILIAVPCRTSIAVVRFLAHL